MGAPQYEQAGADIGGTGTPNTIPRWTGPSTLGDSIITQSGTNRIGVTGAIWCDVSGGVSGVAFGMTETAAIRQTGTNATMYFDASTTGGNGQFIWRSGNSYTERWRINSSGNLLAGADNSYDIGASGATRPRTVYAGTSVIVGPSATAAGTNANAVGANCVASGSNSFAGGFGSTASGAESTALGRNANATASWGAAFGRNSFASGTDSVAIGSSVTASGTGSFASGRFSVAPRYGQNAHASDRFTVTENGSAQKSLLVPFRETTNAAAAKVTLDGAALGAANALSLPNNTAWAADVHLVARSATGAGHAYFVRRVLIKRDANAASTALVGTVQTIGTDIGSNAGAPPAGWAITITADTTNGALDLEVTGAAGTTIRWVARVELVEVSLA